MNTRDLIAKLVAFETVSRNSNLALIDFVRDYLDGYGIASHLIPDDSGTKANLYATVGPPVGDGIVLSGHTDVVPVDGQPWETDPFTVVERDGKLYGRGTSDMKSFCAAALSLVPDMKKLKKPIHFAFSYDEEVGCQGAPRMIKDLMAHVPRPRGVIVGEPTNLQVVTSHKGIAALKTTVTGHEAHSSQTHRGVSAVMTAARLVNFLEQLAQGRKQKGPFVEGFEPDFTTVHVGTIHGGTAVNIISRHCEFMWDIRSLPCDDPQDIIQSFLTYCRDMEPDMKVISPQAGIVTEIIANAPALGDEPDNDAARLVCALTGEQASHKVPYATEGGQFQEAGLPVVICGPGSIDQAHKPNEFITLQQVEAGTAFLSRLIAQLS
jgi:acetylornithine deacetylase